MASPFFLSHKDMIYHDVSALGGVLFFILVSFICLFVNQYLVFLKLSLGFILLYIVILAIRSVYFKDRPIKYEYSTLIERLDASSFPSMHAARIILFGFVFIDVFHSIYISFLLILVIGAVGLSRIVMQKHDWIDVLGGYTIGLITYGIVSLVSRSVLSLPLFPFQLV